jgi:hypothetical protein
VRFYKSDTQGPASGAAGWPGARLEGMSICGRAVVGAVGRSPSTARPSRLWRRHGVALCVRRRLPRRDTAIVKALAGGDPSGSRADLARGAPRRSGEVGKERSSLTSMFYSGGGRYDIALGAVRGSAAQARLHAAPCDCVAQRRHGQDGELAVPWGRDCTGR